MKKKHYSFQKNIFRVISDNNLLQQGDGVVVAVSGGSDSIALLFVLRALSIDLRLIAVYVDHCLRPDETVLEIQKIQELCSTLDIQLVTRAVNVKQLACNQKISTEEAARLLRYQALEEIKNQYNFDKIAVGHNADDQVEQFFIRLFRGSGTTGLAGMHLQQGNIIRPLLYETKQSIEEYLIQNHISWSLDSSNLTRDFLRNRIRLDLLPEIESHYNPGIRNNVLNSMNVLQEEDNFLTGISEQTYCQCVKEIVHDDKGKQSLFIRLNREGYLSHHVALRRRILEKICWKMTSRPSFIMIADIDQLAQAGENGKELHLSEGLRVTKKQSILQFYHPPLGKNKRGRVELPKPYKVLVDNPGSYRIPGTTMSVTLFEETTNVTPACKNLKLRVDLEKLRFPLIIRGVLPGERFTPYSGVGSKKISRYFNDQKLDKDKRGSWPILFCQNAVVAIVGYTIEHQFRVTKATTRVLNISYSDKMNTT